MNRLICEDCGSIFYSAAARTLAERGQRCELCGGLLHAPDDPPLDDEVGVGVDNGDGPADSER